MATMTEISFKIGMLSFLIAVSIAAVALMGEDASVSMWAQPLDSFSVTIISPNGGEAWAGGAAQDINYVIVGGTPNYTVELYYTTDNLSFTFIGYDNRTENGSYAYPWTVPVIDNTSVSILLNVTDNASMSCSDTSDGYFEIDSTRPIAVTDLTLNDTSAGSITLTWTAPGDDGANGTAAGYDVRYDSVPITDANWENATQAGGEPMPGEAGSIETFVVDDLNMGRTYYFALKTTDNAGLVSALSNIINGTTLIIAVNVAVDSPNGAEAIPGSNASLMEYTITGGAAPYTVLLSYSTDAGANWTRIGYHNQSTSGTFVYTSWDTSGITSTSCLVRARLNDSFTWHQDESDAHFEIDSMRPAGVTNLTAVNMTANSITLTWTAPGDDGADGTAAGYDVRYDSVPITDANWGNTTQAGGEPVPGEAGSIETFVVDDLNMGRTYYLALKTTDNAGLVSTLSNIINGTTLIIAVNVTVNSPNGAEAFQGDRTSQIEYTIIGGEAPYTVLLSYSVDAGANWTQIGHHDQSASGTFVYTSWDTRDMTSTNCLVRVRLNDSFTWHQDESDAVFEIDSTAPAVVDDLAIAERTTTSITLTWTAPGDDGASGAAASYDVRYRTGSITIYNWGTANETTGEPAPGAAGSVETFTITGLALNTTYYFALKTTDNVGHVSGLSNSPHATTIAAINVTLNSPNGDEVWRGNSMTTIEYTIIGGAAPYTVMLSYSADGGTFWTLIVYHNQTTSGMLRYTLWDTTAITSANCIAKVKVNDSFTSQQDESDSVFSIDSTPPSTIYLEAIRDVAFQGSPTAHSVKLKWQAVGDDGMLGNAMSYDIRYNTVPIINETNWAQSYQCAGEPTPNTMGTEERFWVTGLLDDTRYYFAIRAKDNVGLISGLSNSPTLSTLEEVIWGEEGTNQNIMTDTTVRYTEIRLYGMLNIIGATLEFHEVLLRVFAPSDYTFIIEVAPSALLGGKFRVFDSNITSATDYKYFMRVSARGTLMMLRSSIHDCGGALEDLPESKDFGLEIYTNEFVMDSCLMTNSRKINIHHSFPVSPPYIANTTITHNYAGITLKAIEGAEFSANYINLINVTFSHCYIGVDCQGSVLGLDRCKFYNNTFGAIYTNSPPDILHNLSGRVYLCIFKGNTYALKSTRSIIDLIGVELVDNTRLTWHNKMIADEVYATIYSLDSILTITRDTDTGTDCVIVNNGNLNWEGCEISDSTFATIYCKNTTLSIDNANISHNMAITCKDTKIVNHLDMLGMFDAIAATIYCIQTTRMDIVDSVLTGNGRPFSAVRSTYVVNVTISSTPEPEYIEEELYIDNIYFTISEGFARFHFTRNTFTNNCNGILAVASTVSVSHSDIIDCDWGILSMLSPLTIKYNNISANSKFTDWSSYPEGYGIFCALAEASFTNNTFLGNDLSLLLLGIVETPDLPVLPFMPIGAALVKLLTFIINVSYALELWNEVNVVAGIYNNALPDIVYSGIFVIYATVTLTNNYIQGVPYLEYNELSLNFFSLWSTCTFISETWHAGGVGIIYLDSELTFTKCSITRFDFAGVLSYYLLLLMWWAEYAEEFDENSVLTMTETLVADSGYIDFDGITVPLYFGGVACGNTTVDVSNCTFTHNLPKGLLAWLSPVTVRDTTISGSTAKIEVYQSTLDVEHVKFIGGSSGIAASHSNIKIKYCTFDENDGSSISVMGCSGTIRSNSMRNGATGIDSTSSTLLIMDNDISDNYNGISSNQDNLNITENHIRSNTGAGIKCRYSSPDITVNSIEGNNYGLYIDTKCSPFIANNTIAYNTLYGIYCLVNSYPTILHNLISENDGVGLYISDCRLKRAKVIASLFWENDIGMQIESSVMYIENCSLSKNDQGITAHQATLDVYDVYLSYGTFGLYLDASPYVNLTNVTIANYAYGIYSVTSVLSIENCTITDNIYNSTWHTPSESISGNATSTWNVGGEPDDSYATLAGNGKYVATTGYVVPPSPIDKVEIVCEWHTYLIIDDYLLLRYTLDGGETYGNTTFADPTSHARDVTAYLDVTGDRDWTYADISKLTIECKYVVDNNVDVNGRAELRIDAIWVRVTNAEGIIAVRSTIAMLNTTFSDNSGDMALQSSVIECVNSTFTTSKLWFDDFMSSIEFLCYLNIDVVWQNGVPVANASVVIVDALERVVYDNYTDANGSIIRIKVSARSINKTGEHLRVPHTVNASRHAMSTEERVWVDQTGYLRLTIIDPMEPALDVEPLPFAVTNNPQLQVTGTASDNTEVYRIEAKLNAGAWASCTIIGSTGTYPQTVEWAYTITLAEGDNTITIRAQDPAGNDIEEVAYITLDTTAPVLNITMPARTPYYTNQAVFKIVGMSDNSARNLTINNEELELTDNYTFEKTYDLTVGKHVFTIVVTDDLNERRLVYTVYLDKTAPFIAITKPRVTITNVKQLIIEGWTDGDAIVTINGVGVSTINGAFTHALTLVEGTNQIGIVAKDLAGNQESKTLSITLDTTKPAIALDSTPPTTTEAKTYTVSGTTEAGARIYINDIEVSVGENNSFSKALALADGVNNFTIRAIDAAGNVNSYNVSIERLVAPTADGDGDWEYTQWLWLAMTAVIIALVLLVVLILVKKRRSKKEGQEHIGERQQQ